MGEVYTGIVGSYVVPALRTARTSLDIVSPYLSPEYSHLLVSKARSGLRVRVLTSDSVGNPQHRQALAILRPGTEFYVSNRWFWYYVLAAIASGTAVSLVSPIIGVVLALIGVITAIAAGIRTRPRAPYGLRVIAMSAARLVHAKLYIVDGQVAFTGSANLTYSGMNRNIERIEVKTLPAEVQQEIDAFSALWGPDTAQPSLEPVKWKNKARFREIRRQFGAGQMKGVGLCSCLF